MYFRKIIPRMFKNRILFGEEVASPFWENDYDQLYISF